MKQSHHTVPLDRRWTILTITRLGLAVGSVIAATVIRDLPYVDEQLVLQSSLLYAAVVVVGDLLRRVTGARALWLVGIMVAVDAVFLARVVGATGDTVSPLNALVYLHIVAVTLVVSLRLGLESAIWHAGLVLVAASEMGPLLVGSESATAPGSVTLHLCSYLVVAIAAAAYASVDERALRRARADLSGQVRLLRDLEEASTVPATTLAMGRHVIESMGFSRAVLVVETPGRPCVLTISSDGSHALVDSSSAAERAVLDLVRDGGARLVSSIDGEAQPLLAELLPGGCNLVGVPVIIDDDPRGAIMAEWPTGRRRREVPVATVEQLELVGRYGGLALSSALLLAEVEERSRRDLVTGLRNRRAFEDALAVELSRTSRSAGVTSVVLLDLDHFKQVNDTEGHEAGDQVLRAVGRALVSAGRPHDLVARIGGDEFAMVLPDCRIEDAMSVAERARAAVWDQVGDRGVSACAGVACSPEHGTRPRELVRQADRALYRAKDAGRNEVMRARPMTDSSAVIDLIAAESASVSG